MVLTVYAIYQDLFAIVIAKITNKQVEDTAGQVDSGLPNYPARTIPKMPFRPSL